MPKTDFWCRLNLLENMLNAGFFFLLLFLFVKTGKKFQSACVVFYMNNMLFFRKYGDMSMHVVILYHADLM